MLKKIKILLFFLFVSLYSMAQWGVKGGVNLSGFTDNNLAKYRTGFQLGTTYDKQLSENWYLQPALLFVSYGTNYKDDHLLARGGYVAMYGLELPINFSFRPRITENIRLVADGGLYGRYALFGTKKYQYYDLPTTKGDAFPAYKRFDMGINLGIGLQKDRYTLGVAYTLSFTGVEPGSSSNHQAYRLSLGYLF